MSERSKRKGRGKAKQEQPRIFRQDSGNGRLQGCSKLVQESKQESKGESSCTKLSSPADTGSAKRPEKEKLVPGTGEDMAIDLAGGAK